MALPSNQKQLAQKYGKQYGIDPNVLLAIAGHETQWGTTGAGRPSQGNYALGYGVTDSKTLSKYAGLENQYKYAAMTLSHWGVKSINDILAGKAASYATDPNWEHGVASVYNSLAGGGVPEAATTPIKPGRAQQAPGPTPPGVTPAAGSPTDPMLGLQDYLKKNALQTIVQQSVQLAQSGDVNAYTQGILGIANQRQAIQGMAGMLGQAGMGAGAPAVDPHGTINHPQAVVKGGGGAIVQSAAQQIGQPYVWGGESRKEGGFDCSGLVDWAMRQHGYTGGRITTQSALKMGVSVKKDQLQPGDWIIANDAKHMVIYAGNGKVIAAPHTGTVVQYQPLSHFTNITDIRRVT